LSIPGWIVGGLLVGYGTKMSGADTTGHTQGGIIRLNKRHILAISIFVLAGMLMATIRYHFPFFSKGFPLSVEFNGIWGWITFGLYCAMAVYFIVILILNRESGYNKEYLISFANGLLFGMGLLISGFCKISKVIGLLTLDL